MDHFAVSSLLLDDVSSFQREDFEAAWTLAQEEAAESDIDFDLFATSPLPTNDLNFDLFDNMDIVNADPLLSAAALDYDNLLFGPCSPIMNESDPVLDIVEKEESVKPEENVVEQEQEDEEVDYPTNVHSYAQQPEQEHHEEVEKSDSDDDDEMEQEDQIVSPVSGPVTRRRRPRRSNIKRRTVSSEDESKAIFSNGKPKLYTQRPFKNPDMERARLNALNAKINRERKKQEADNLKRELERLRKENVQLKKTSSNLNSRASRAEQELTRIRQVLEQADLVNVLKWSSGKNENLV